MPLVWKVYVDLLTGDGVPDDDISAYWMATRLVQGFREEDQHLADTGQCVITLNNDDRRFSPNFAGGPYYGNLLAGRAVKLAVVNDGGSELEQFVGVVDTKGWRPASGIKAGPFTCELIVVDFMRQLQEANITMALMEDFPASEIITLLTNAAFEGGVTVGEIEFIGPMAADDTASIGQTSSIAQPWISSVPDVLQLYTFKAALTGAANEILIETDTDGSDITPENLAAAINGDLGEGTAYGSGTTRNAGFSASSRARVGEGSAGRDGWVPLRDTGSGYDKLSTSFVIKTDTITTNVIWLNLLKTGSPTGTATVKFILNARGLPNDVQYKTVSGTFAESGAAVWTRVELDDYITFRRYQRYHVELSTDRAASASDYISWGEISGTNNYSAENTGGTWTSLGTALVWCIPGSVRIKARWRGSVFNDLRFAASNTGNTYFPSEGGPPYVANLSGGSDAPTSLTDFEDDATTIQVIGDQWSGDRVQARRGLEDTVKSSGGYLYCAEDGTITYKRWTWPFAAQAVTASLTLDNEQNQTNLRYGKALINRCRVEYEERLEIANSTVARASGSIELPPNVKEDPEDYATEQVDGLPEGAVKEEIKEDAKQMHGLRFNPNDDVPRTTVVIPFVDDDRGVVTGAKDITQPIPGTHFTLTTEPNGEGRNATYLAQTRGGGMKIATAITGGGVQITARSTTGITSLYINDLSIVGTLLLRLNTQTVIYENAVSIDAHGVKEETIRLPALNAYGREWAESLAHYTVGRNADEREYIESCGFRGQTTINGVKLYGVGVGSVVSITEDQTAIDGQTSLIIGRTIADTKRREEPELTWILRPISDQTYWLLDHATYGDLPARLAI